MKKHQNDPKVVGKNHEWPQPLLKDQSESRKLELANGVNEKEEDNNTLSEHSVSNLLICEFRDSKNNTASFLNDMREDSICAVHKHNKPFE